MTADNSSGSRQQPDPLLVLVASLIIFYLILVAIRIAL